MSALLAWLFRARLLPLEDSGVPLVEGDGEEPEVRTRLFAISCSISESTGNENSSRKKGCVARLSVGLGDEGG